MLVPPRGPDAGEQRVPPEPADGIDDWAVGRAYVSGQLSSPRSRVQPWRTQDIGGQTLGTLTGGLLGSTVGLRLTFLLSSVGMLLACVCAVRSPLTTLD